MYSEHSGTEWTDLPRALDLDDRARRRLSRGPYAAILHARRGASKERSPIQTSARFATDSWSKGSTSRARKPDVIVINSCHLVSTFSTLVDGTSRHRGTLTAQEAPDLIAGVEFDFPGDGAFASALVARAKAAGHLSGLVDDPHYPLDYGTVMPIVCYLDPGQSIPVVPISVTLLNDLDECFAWGRHVVSTLREVGRRGVFVASGALSHRLVRGPERWPLPEDRKRDERFARMLADGDYDGLFRWLPEFASAVEAEMGGRHLAMMLGRSEGGGLRLHRHRSCVRSVVWKRELRDLAGLFGLHDLVKELGGEVHDGEASIETGHRRHGVELLEARARAPRGDGMEAGSFGRRHEQQTEEHELSGLHVEARRIHAVGAHLLLQYGGASDPPRR